MMSPGQKFINKLQNVVSYRKKWLDQIAWGIMRTPTALNVPDFRMLKDFLVKEALTNDARIPVQAVEGKPYDLVECDFMATISLKIQNEVFPRKKIRGPGLTKMPSLMLKNTMSESDEEIDYVPSWDVLMAVQPPNPQKGQKFVVAVMDAGRILKDEKLIKKNRHQVKLVAGVKDWDGAWSPASMPQAISMERLNEIFLTRIGHGGTVWKELLHAK